MGSWFEDDRLLDHYLSRIGEESGEPPELEGYAEMRPVSTGGQGVVYAARRLADGQAVALKMLSRAGPAWSQGQLRMTREGEILANLEHPGIVRFFELVEDAQGRAVVIMEWIEGGPLSAQLPFGPRSALFPTLHSWVGCVIQIADAVEAAHQSEVYHRDLKPSNVLLGQRAQPKLVDFGIGLDAAFEDDRLTRSGVVLGSQAYAAPEQRVPRSRADPNETVAELVAVDVYGLGGILYEGLAGSPPHGFHGGARRAIPSPPSAIRRPSWDARLEGILMKALEAKPERRYLSARELGRDLRAWLAGERVQARSFGPMKRLAWHLRQGLRPTKLREGAD